MAPRRSTVPVQNEEPVIEQEAMQEPVPARITPEADKTPLSDTATKAEAVQNERKVFPYEQFEFYSVFPGSKAWNMKESLRKQTLIRIYIPRNRGEPINSTLPVTLNQYRLDIPKGRYLDLPQQVAEVIMDSIGQTDDALLRSPMSADRTEVKGGVSLQEALNM